MTTAHEPHRGPGTHLSVDDLSALAEGAQPTAEGASEHLLDCAVCRDEVDAIAQLIAAFETLEAPRLPQEVAIRIDAALAREAAARISVPQADASAEAAAVAGKSSRGRRRPWLSRRVGLGLASLVAVVGGLTLAINLVSSTDTQTGSAASGSRALKPDAATGGPQRAEGQLESPKMLSATSPLAVWVQQTLGGTKPALEVNSPCRADPAFAVEQPLRVVNGLFEGKSATLVVYPNGGDTKTVEAVVYAQPCTVTSYQVLAQGIVAR